MRSNSAAAATAALPAADGVWGVGKWNTIVVCVFVCVGGIVILFHCTVCGNHCGTLVVVLTTRSYCVHCVDCLHLIPAMILFYVVKKTGLVSVALAGGHAFFLLSIWPRVAVNDRAMIFN